MTEKNSWLPPGGTNLFQEIKKKSTEAESSGKKLIRLSIGQPSGPALLSAREAAAKAIMSDSESMHEYQDNGSPGVPDFAKRFVQCHVQADLNDKDVDFLPTPGIKPMLGLVILACGSHLKNKTTLKVRTMTKPGYPTPADWCRYLQVEHTPLDLNPENQFLFSTNEIILTSNLVIANYPHNPSGQIATRKFWEEICKYCEKYHIRIFNDSAYSALSYSLRFSTLADVAINFPNLSWAEAFSASKAIANGTGWRIGAMVGSKDFISDIKTIKGNSDSGFAAFAAAGVIYAMENDKEEVDNCRKKYASRLYNLISVLEGTGMRLAVMPMAGFFTLWQVPKKAYGENIESAEHFNYLMIEKTGIVGVHFNPDYIRYSVTGPVEDYLDEIVTGFKNAKIEY